MVLYTDGTLAPTPEGFAGCGFVIHHNGEAYSGSRYLGKGYHSGTAEVEAALFGLEKAVTISTDCAIHLKTDCQLVFYRLQNRLQSKPDNSTTCPYDECLSKIDTLLNMFRSVSVSLIPRSDNLADQLAQQSLDGVRGSYEWEYLISRALRKYANNSKSPRRVRNRKYRDKISARFRKKATKRGR